MVKKMSEGKVFVYAADTAALGDDTVFASGYRMVSDSRREKIDRMVFRKDKQLSLGAGLLLMECLRRHGIESYQLGYGAHGKPYLKAYRNQDGCWHTENPICFNLSHSGERVMCAVSDQEVGCDVERVKDVEFSVARRFFTSQEYEQLASLCSYQEKKQMFFRIWTKKESYMKATGRGISLSPESFCIGNGSSIPGYFFCEYDLQDGYCYAVCGRTEGFMDTLQFLDYRLLIRKFGSIM